MIKIKKIVIIIFSYFIFINTVFSNEKLDKLKIFLEKGLITEDEFKRALDKIETKNSRISVNKISGKTGKEKFEKYEFFVDNFRIFTLGPGVIRVDNMLTGKTDVTLSDNFKIKINDNGKKYFKFQVDEKNLSSKLFYKGRLLINWSGKFVRRYSATFYQMQVLGSIPFHFYIKIPGKNNISVNMDQFNNKIEKALKKIKQELSIKYNITIEDIDRMMEKRDKIISSEKEKLIKELTEKYAGKEITDSIRAEIEKTIGQEMSNAFISEIEKITGQQIDDAIENEIASAIDQAIAEAVENGISEATAAAAIAAMIYVYSIGGSDADAMDACRSIAGDAC